MAYNVEETIRSKLRSSNDTCNTKWSITSRNTSAACKYNNTIIPFRFSRFSSRVYIFNCNVQPIAQSAIFLVPVSASRSVSPANKPSRCWKLQVHPCGRYRHNTVVFILAKEYNLKNLRTIHRLDRLTSGILLFGRTPKKARQMEHQIRNRQVRFVTLIREGIFHKFCRRPGEKRVKLRLNWETLELDWMREEKR